MSTTPKQPCAPPLNLVANGPAGSAFPTPPGDSDLPPVDTDPGFGDALAAILDDVGSDADGFDQVVSDTVGLIDGLDAVLAAQDADLDTILTLLSETDTSPTSTALGDYANSFGVGNELLASAQGLAVPDLGFLNTLWVGPGTQTVPPPTGPGVQQAGQISVGDPPFTWRWNRGLSSIGPGGVTSARLNTPSNIFTAVRLVNAFWYNPPFTVDVHHYTGELLVVMDIDINPQVEGIYTDFVVLNLDLPLLGNEIALPIALQVVAKPAPTLHL